PDSSSGWQRDWSSTSVTDIKTADWRQKIEKELFFAAGFGRGTFVMCHGCTRRATCRAGRETLGGI
ncbi:MAG: hypothetical protein ACKOCH_05915, partial [Bacteroidota bacterium]